MSDDLTDRHWRAYRRRTVAVSRLRILFLAPTADLLVRGALVLVGLGYLASTGALHEFGTAIFGEAAMLDPAR